jgi:hypothetical protein
MAPMKSKFLSYWEQLCNGLDRRDIAAPLLVSIEKTGRFVDHARAIQDHIKPGHVMVLDTPYVNQYIVNQKPDHFYGQDEFYGRRFFYRTTTGEVLVVTVPRLPSGRPYEKPQRIPTVPLSLGQKSNWPLTRRCVPRLRHSTFYRPASTPTPLSPSRWHTRRPRCRSGPVAAF